MPVTIGTFEPFSEAKFDALRRKPGGTTNWGLVELLDEIETGQPIRVPLVQGQGARGLRAAPRAATWCSR
jgi:hypothetical protein